MHLRGVTGALAAVAAFFALYTTTAQAQGTGTIVELVITPCDPGVRREECGAKMKVVSGNATFTMTNGQTENMTAGEVLSVNGNGAATQQSQSGTILTFASTGSTGGGGGGGGGGGTTGSLGQNGGSNTGSSGGPTNLATNNTGGGSNLTGGGASGGSGGSTTPSLATSTTP
jgi:hypothetical protein